jgi:hypothetical protein
MNTSLSFYPTQDIYYYADNYNYTDDYRQKYVLSQQLSCITGICYIAFSTVSLVLYLRLITVINLYILINIILHLIDNLL